MIEGCAESTLESFDYAVENAFKYLHEKSERNVQDIIKNFKTFLDHFFHDTHVNILILGGGYTTKRILEQDDLINRITIFPYVDQTYKKEYDDESFSDAIKRGWVFNYTYGEDRTRDLSAINLFAIGLEGTTAKKGFKWSIFHDARSTEKIPAPIIRLINSARKKYLQDLLKRINKMNIISVAFTEDCKHELEMDFICRQNRYGIKPVIVNFEDFDEIITNVGIFGKENEKIWKKLIGAPPVESAGPPISRPLTIMNILFTQAGKDTCPWQWYRPLEREFKSRMGGRRNLSFQFNSHQLWLYIVPF